MPESIVNSETSDQLELEVTPQITAEGVPLVEHQGRHYVVIDHSSAPSIFSNDTGGSLSSELERLSQTVMAQQRALDKLLAREEGETTHEPPSLLINDDEDDDDNGDTLRQRGVPR